MVIITVSFADFIYSIVVRYNILVINVFPIIISYYMIDLNILKYYKIIILRSPYLLFIYLENFLD